MSEDGIGQEINKAVFFDLTHSLDKPILDGIHGLRDKYDHSDVGFTIEMWVQDLQRIWREIEDLLRLRDVVVEVHKLQSCVARLNRPTMKKLGLVSPEPSRDELHLFLENLHQNLWGTQELRDWCNHYHILLSKFINWLKQTDNALGYEIKHKNRLQELSKFQNYKHLVDHLTGVIQDAIKTADQTQRGLSRLIDQTLQPRLDILFRMESSARLLVNNLKDSDRANITQTGMGDGGSTGFEIETHG